MIESEWNVSLITFIKSEFVEIKCLNVAVFTFNLSSNFFYILVDEVIEQHLRVEDY